MDTTLACNCTDPALRSEDALFASAFAGDEIALAEVYRRFRAPMHRFCMSRVHDTHLADEAVQEVFLRLIQSRGDGILHPRRWLFGIARNVCADMRGRERVSVAAEGVIESRLGSVADTAEEYLGRCGTENLFLALRMLRKRYRRALILREFKGATSASMAVEFGVSVGAVDTLVSRSRDAFARSLGYVDQLSDECQRTTHTLYRRLDGPERAPLPLAVSVHLGECPRCRAEAARARRSGALAILPSLPAASASGSLLSRIGATVSRLVSDLMPMLTGHTVHAARLAAGFLAVGAVVMPMLSGGAPIQRDAGVVESTRTEIARAMSRHDGEPAVGNPPRRSTSPLPVAAIVAGESLPYEAGTTERVMPVGDPRHSSVGPKVPETPHPAGGGDSTGDHRVSSVSGAPRTSDSENGGVVSGPMGGAGSDTAGGSHDGGSEARTGAVSDSQPPAETCEDGRGNG